MDIFVAKLSSETTSDQIKELFSQYGQVNSVKLIMDRETGMSKCYGFVEMDDEEGSAAIEHLNDTNFMGKYIVVKESEPRSTEKRSFDKRPSGGGGRRPDGGNRGRFDRNNSFRRGGDNRGGSGGGREHRRGDFNRYE